MVVKNPLVTIGVPVYNGEAYIKKALKSLVSQDYENIEVIISDNASTDATSLICQEYAGRHPKIKYERNLCNLGAVANFNKLPTLASGKYFMWAAYDDLWDSLYVSRCVRVLESDPSLIGCTTSLRFIDENDSIIQNIDYSGYDNPDLSCSDVGSRIASWLDRSGWYSIYGLYRTSAIASQQVEDSYGSDVLFVLKLLFQGRIANIPDVLFYYRIFPEKTEQDRYQGQGESLEQKKLNFLHTQLALTSLDTIWKSELLKQDEKKACCELMISTLLRSNIWQWRLQNDQKSLSSTDLRDFIKNQNINLFNNDDQKELTRCCLIEQNPCHEFILPSVVYALNQLGIHVDVYLHPQAITRDPFFYIKDLRYNLYSTESPEFAFLRVVLGYSAYDVVFFNSIENFVQKTSIPSTTSDIEHYLKFTSVVGIVHHLDEIQAGQEYHPLTLKQEHVQLFTIHPCLNNKSQILPDKNWINPIYYCDDSQQLKNNRKSSQEVIFVVQGNVEFSRRDYIGLLDTVQEISRQLDNSFKIRIVGQSHFPDGIEFKRQVQLRGLNAYFEFIPTNSNFDVFYREIASADYILFLIDRTTNTWSSYYESIVSSSVATCIALGVVPIIHDELASRYEIQGITYSNGNLNLAMIGAIQGYQTTMFYEYQSHLQYQAKYLRLVNTYNLAKSLELMGLHVEDKIKFLKLRLNEVSKNMIKRSPHLKTPYTYLSKD